ncbi:MAG: hypothetical protein ISS48_04685 [Candidatus Aenigmarchaeota archaeon]|nr:hypothetical protein [Candidatus Aenigmarchaeota archaeon]
MKKKELLIIFVLAVLVTGLSWFFPREFKGEHGFPFRFSWGEWGGRSGPLIYSVDYIIKWSWQNLLLNLLFWFLVLAVGWWIIKKLKTKKR